MTDEAVPQYQNVSNSSSIFLSGVVGKLVKLYQCWYITITKLLYYSGKFVEEGLSQRHTLA